MVDQTHFSLFKKTRSKLKKAFSSLNLILFESKNIDLFWTIDWALDWPGSDSWPDQHSVGVLLLYKGKPEIPIGNFNGINVFRESADC